MCVLAIDLIRMNGTQSRASLNEETLLDYTEKWHADKPPFPPVKVFRDKEKEHWLGDGFHRVESAKRAKRVSIIADVADGTKEDALLYSLGANQEHGLRRTNEDKQRIVRIMLNHPEWVKWADNRIAEHVGVTQPFVSGIRKQLITVISSPAAKAKDEPKVGKDGKARKARKPKAGKGVKKKGDDPIGDKCQHEWDEDDCCKKCKMENPDKPEPILDAFGKELPDYLHDVFGQSKLWQQAMSFVSQAKGAVTEIKDHRAAMHLDSAELDRLLTQARTNLKFAAPHTECVKCRRKLKADCPHCRGEGWLNKATYTACASDADIAWQEARK